MRMWRRRLALAVLALWAVVSAVRLTRLVEPPETPPGQEAADALDFFRATLPPNARYLFVLPTEFGADSGLGPRLRYELYPRVYEDIRAAQDEAAVRSLVVNERLQYIVVADASQYPSAHWLRAPPAWLRRIDLDGNSYVLEVVS